ncbi:MAG: hypothetical protein KKB70_03965 [Proteobacteria bacterium]|nr:hypothetical protein [Pseudomonadota bacterium]MBU1610306.1 hypothetical protein [Pseudomonadota bacterium]
MQLTDKSKIAIVGGGPAGSLTAYFLLELAKRKRMSIQVDIFEKKDFQGFGPKSCNHCGGIISESLIQMLALERIVLPADVVQLGIESYVLHAEGQAVPIKNRSKEKRIASVYRGGGPRGSIAPSWSSFDAHLLKMCETNGARIVTERVTEIQFEDGFPVIQADERHGPYELVIGAVGVNARSSRLFHGIIEHEEPETARCYIAELPLGRETLANVIGKAMHVFLVAMPEVEFAAIIPKKEYASVCMLGDITPDIVKKFLSSPEVRHLFADDPSLLEKACNCLPKINMSGVPRPFADRIALVGDCGTTRLYKDGIGAAYRLSKHLAYTAIFQGVSAKDFERNYLPFVNRMRRDNNIGKFIFAVVTAITRFSYFRKVVVRMVEREQNNPDVPQDMSAILWDVFTGSAPYADILRRSLRPGFIGRFLWTVLAAVFPTNKDTGHV